MASFRPQTGAGYLTRNRLLGLLPDQAGRVVWLEAPYGYGKTILASQWADRLEEDGWRIVWTVLGGREPRALVARALELPETAPWGVLLDALWQEPTLLVIEDLETIEEHESLAPLLKDVHGLVLLASRSGITCSELPRLTTKQQLLHLSSAELGFSEAEAHELFEDAEAAEDAWRRTNGWPLPLHFALLTGSLPERTGLLEGMRSSLSDELWAEALLLAGVTMLPDEAANAATKQLARSGFAQHMESGYRLHPLVGDALLRAHGPAAAGVLKQEAERLPVLERADAFERTGLHAELGQLLENIDEQLWRQAPESVLRWDALLGTPASALRHLAAGGALKVLGRHRESAARLEAALTGEELSLDAQLAALGDLCWVQAMFDTDSAANTVRRAESLLGGADPERAGRFLANAFIVDIVRGEFSEALAKLRRALDFFPPDSPYRLGAEINHALVRWDELGDVDTRFSVQTDTLPDVWRQYPSDAPGQARDVAMFNAWLGNHETARTYFEEALRGARHNPLVGLEAEAALAALDGNAEPFPRLLRQAEAWADPYTLEMITMHGLNAFRDDARAARAFWERSPAKAGIAAAAYAPQLAAAGSREEALALVTENLEQHSDRARQLYLKAARYRLTRDPAHLTDFLRHTSAGERLLPAFVPLGELPRDQPELARTYPLGEVLESDWSEARDLRAAELPDLEINLLGRLQVKLLGRDVHLTDRQQQLVTLLTLGLSREEAAEAMWPETDAAKQRNNLGVQVSLLRRTLEPWGSRTYVTESGLDRYSADIDGLKAALADGNAAAVLRLYREPLAPGLTLDAVQAAGEQFRQETVSVLVEGARTADSAAAQEYLKRVLELEPLHEEALQQLLSRLLRLGRRQEAVQRYDAFARQLRQELDLEPLPETSALLDSVGSGR